MREGTFERQLRRTGRLLEERRDALVAGLRRHAGELLDVGGTAAGMHVVGWLRAHRPAQLPDLVARAAEEQLGLYPISPYYAAAPRRAGLRRGYAGLSPRDLHEAARRLGALLRATARS